MKHDRTFDELTKALAPCSADWRDTVGAIAIDLAGKLATGLAIGIEFAVGRALAG